MLNTQTQRPEPKAPLPKVEPQSAPAGALSQSLGSWIHEHKGITDSNPVGYTVYQFLRSAAAAAPYGVSMAATWLAFEKMGKYGGHLAETALKGSTSEIFGTRLKQFCTTPAVRSSAMIGTSFSLYRGTSKIGKWVNESLFNEHDTEAQTVQKLEQLPSALWGKICEVMPAEIHSTPVAAIVLGFMVNAFHAPPALGKALQSCKGKGFDHFWKEVIVNPETKFVEHAAINTIGYSLFFELGDRRFKDKQISRGMWSGEAHSIGSKSRSSPSLTSKDDMLSPAAPDAKQGDDERVGSEHNNDTLSLLTSEPSTMRFALRRVVPTAIGISAYTAFKMRGAPLILGKFTAADKGSRALEKVSDIPFHAWREGAATSLFFMIPFVTDKYVKWYDNLVNGLEEMVSGRKAPESPAVAPESRDVIQHKHRELKDQLDQKEQGKGMAIS